MMLRISKQEAFERGWLSKSESKRTRTPAPGRLWRQDRMMPQARLLALLQQRWGDAVVSECPAGVPGRRFRVDAAFPEARLAIECDGFQYHRSLSAFRQDRQRQNLLQIHGWRVLRYTVGVIVNDPARVVSEVEQALAEPPKSHK